MKVITLKSTSETFPPRLKHLHNVPTQLFLSGNADLNDLLKRPVLAVVGSRKITPYGKSVLHEMLPKLCRAGVVIVSGLAYGADIIAHQIALENNAPTIAVLPSPLDKIYPATHASTAKIITENGLLLTEYDSGADVQNHNFIYRNRIIAALADAILIPEAAEKSGSLHTARFGLEIGRNILAVPGNINSPVSIGTNNLIKHGATPVTDVNDIFEALNILPNKQSAPLGDTPEEQSIINAIFNGVSDTDEMLNASELTLDKFNQALGMLEITGVIGSVGNSKWIIK